MLMKNRKRNFFWNMVIVIAVILCLAAFALHYKNWTSLEEDTFSVHSGIYSQKIILSDVTTIDWVAKLPQMERKNGFSWLAREKGIFKDSVTGSKVYVFVDDLKQQKLKLSYKDSLQLFFNTTDSLEMQEFYIKVNMKMDSLKNIQN